MRITLYVKFAAITIDILMQDKLQIIPNMGYIKGTQSAGVRIQWTIVFFVNLVARQYITATTASLTMSAKLILRFFAIVCIISVTFAWVGRSEISRNPGNKYEMQVKMANWMQPIFFFRSVLVAQIIQTNVGQMKLVPNIRRVNHSRCHWDASNTFVMTVYTSICMGSYQYKQFAEFSIGYYYKN